MDMTNLVKQMNEISSAIMYATEGLDLDDVLKRIAEVSRNLVQCKYAALGIPDDKGGLAHFKVSGISDEQASKIIHLPVGHGLIRAPMRERHVIRLARMQDDDRSVGFPDHHPPMTSLLGVPIQMGEQLFGVLYLCDRIDGQPFTEDDQLLIETMASYAALVIVSATSNDQHSRLKVLEERERIGMELHDGVIQSLYALGMQLDLLRLKEGLQPNHLKPIISGLDEVIGDIRHYITRLRKIEGKPQTVQLYLESMVQKLHLSDKLNIQIHGIDAYPPFTPAKFESICLIINEALSNAVRHSQASNIVITVNIINNHFDVSVEDDGNGFDIAQIKKTGLGINNMHKRANFHGGRIHINSTLGEGTRLDIKIPIKQF